MMIVSQKWCEGKLADVNDNLNLEANGTGAYQLSEIASNGDVTLKRFEGFHGTASIDTINFKLVTGSKELAFESGDVDVASYGAVAFEAVKEYSNVETESVITNNVAFIINNCSEASPMNNKSVREAAVRALNRVDVGLILSDGGGTTAYNMATPLVDFYADVCDHYDQDLEKANSLMSAAGYSESNRCPITLVVLSDPHWVAACEVIKENLEKSFFTVSIEELADTTRYFTGEFDMAVIAIGLTNSFTSYAALFDNESGLNLAVIGGPEREEVLAKVMASADEASAQEAMKAVVDTLAYVPLCYTTNFEVFDADLNHGDFYTSRGDFLYSEFSWKK